MRWTIPCSKTSSRVAHQSPGPLRRVCAAAFAIGAIALAVVTLPSPARAQNIVALVNGEPITQFDIEQRAKLIQLSTRKSPSSKETLEELISEKVKVREARKFNLKVSEAEIESAYAGMGSRMRLSKDQLTQTLARSGIRPETLKSQIEAGIVWNQLLRGRFGQSLNVSESDVRETLDRNTSKDSSDNFEYRLLPLVLIVPRGSSQGLLTERRNEAEDLRKQISSCTDADRLFRTRAHGAVRPYVTRTSADIPEALRDILNKLEVGKLTAPEITSQGIQMFALCDRRVSAGDSPAKRAAREKVFAEKLQKKSDSYLAEARRSMMIEYRTGR